MFLMMVLRYCLQVLILYQAEEGWRSILRREEHHRRTWHALERPTESPSEDDYQEQMIEQLSFRHQKEI
jgi:hypothetical protein